MSWIKQTPTSVNWNQDSATSSNFSKDTLTSSSWQDTDLFSLLTDENGDELITEEGENIKLEDRETDFVKDTTGSVSWTQV